MKVKTFVISLLALFFLPCLQAVPQAATLATPKLAKVSNYAGGVKVKWKQVKGATGYYVYRKIPGSIFRKIATIKKADRLYYKDPNVASDIAYVYTVMAYKSGKTKVKSAYNKTGLSIVYCEEPALKAQLDSALGIRLFWEKLYCQGYLLYRKEEGGSFKRIAKIEGNHIINYLDTTIKEGKTYYYSIRAYSVYEGKTYYSTYNQDGWKAVHAGGGSPEKSENIIYRALLVGESKYDQIFDPRQSQNLNGPPNDVKYMKKLLSEMNYSSVKVIENVGKMQVLSSIASTFDGADENDVSLFFYSGHGSTDRGAESGSLVLKGTSYEYLTMEELALALLGVPGKVIVILDSCGSGAALNAMPGGVSSAPSESEEDDSPFPVLDPSIFDELVKCTFQRYDTAYRFKYGELLVENKFYVLTASQAHSVSLEIDIGSGVYAGAMTYGLVSGGGYSYFGSDWDLTIPADTDGNDVVTLEEAYSYIYEKVGRILARSKEKQKIVRYPEGSNFPIYGKRNADFSF